MAHKKKKKKKKKKGKKKARYVGKVGETSKFSRVKEA